MLSPDINSMGVIPKEQYLKHCVMCGCLVSSKPTTSLTSDLKSEPGFIVYCSSRFCKLLVKE